MSLASPILGLIVLMCRLTLYKHLYGATRFGAVDIYVYLLKQPSSNRETENREFR